DCYLKKRHRQRAQGVPGVQSRLFGCDCISVEKSRERYAVQRIGQLDSSIAPALDGYLRYWAVAQQSCCQASRHHDQPVALELTGEGDQALGMLASDLQGKIAAFGEQPGVRQAQLQRPRDQPLLDAPVLPLGKQLFRSCVQLECAAAGGEIDGAAVVRIDQAEIPEIRSLVQVRNARRGHAQQRLGQ